MAIVLGMTLGSSGDATSHPGTPEQRTAEICVAVLRQALQEDPMDFGRMYGADASRYPESVRRVVSAGLHDVLPVRFTDTPDRFVLPSSGVRGDGVIVWLGDIPIGDRIQVDWSFYYGNVGGRSMTFYVEMVDGHWKVVGDTGSVGMS